MPAKKHVSDDSDTSVEVSREHRLNANGTRIDADYVLVWIQQTLRAFDNPVIDRALVLANSLKLPVVVYHCLRQDYPYASDRLHFFILQARRALERDLKKLKIRFVSYVERPGHVEKGLVYKLAANAAHVLSDEHFSFVGRSQLARFAAKTEAAVTEV